MQFILFCILPIIFAYSLVFSAPVNQTSQEIKHQQTVAIANHLLNEIANEKQHAEENSNKNLKENSNEENIEYIVPIAVVYPTYNNLNNEESSSDIINIDDYLPIDEQELIRYLEEQQEIDESSIPIMDDSIMKAEDHK